MERFFTFGKFNTWYDWGLIVTAKSVTPPEPKTNYVEIDGMSGSLDLSESLAGEVTYHDRTIEATFWTDRGTRENRETLLKKITTVLHGKKLKIFEPDDPNHYFYGRVMITERENNAAYAEFTIEAVCEPWRYSIFESVRSQTVDSTVDMVIRNNGVKTLCPDIRVTGILDITYDGVTTSATTGVFKISTLKLRQGVNVIRVSGNGTIDLTYREADL